MKTKKIILYIIILVLLIALATLAYLLFAGSPSDHQVAQQHAIEYIAAKYMLQEENLEIESSLYSFGKGYFSIYIVDHSTHEEYFIEVKLKSNGEIQRIYDATGTVIR